MIKDKNHKIDKKCMIAQIIFLFNLFNYNNYNINK